MEVQANRLIGTEGIFATEGGIALELRLPWYRSLPLSTVEVDQVEFDGAKIDSKRVAFMLEGKSYALAELEEQVGHVWYVLDSAYLKIEGLAAAIGSEHVVAVTLNLYPPYIHGLKRPVRDCRKLTLTVEKSLA